VVIGDTDNEDVHSILPIEKTFDLMNQIKVPSILVQKEDSDNFRKILENQENSEILSLAIHFPLVKANDVANIRMILQVDDFRSYDSLLAFHKYREMFRERMNFSVHYKVFKNPKDSTQMEDCVHN
jgi:hypothetical protein